MGLISSQIHGPYIGEAGTFLDISPRPMNTAVAGKREDCPEETHVSKYGELLRKAVGPKIVTSARDLLSHAAEYFEWLESHPLEEEKLHFSKDGDVTRAALTKVRPFTLKGFASYLGVRESDLSRYRASGPDWDLAMDRIEQLIYIQKFENAAAGLLNPMIMARDLGLSERQDISTKGVVVNINGDDANL